MIVSVSGSRDYTDYAYISTTLSQIVALLITQGTPITKIHVGDCRGVDSLVVRYCSEHDIPVQVFPANWSLGPKAGPIRNKQLITGTNMLVAFPKNNSKGTQSAINIATALHIPVQTFLPF